MPTARLLLLSLLWTSCALGPHASHGAPVPPQGPPIPESRASRPAPKPAAAWTPVELAAYYDAQVCGADHDVYGLRLGLLAAENHAVYGLDLTLGVGEQLAGGAGVAVGLVRHVTGGSFAGLQLAFGKNQALDALGPDEVLRGVQLAVLFNEANRVLGIQVGLLNHAQTMHGLQAGLIEGTEHLGGVAVAGLLSYVDSGTGLQIAPLNFCSHTLNGAQIGLFNATGKGLQIGLVNVNQNGFLPVFPILNF